jgi:hypothetical protein
MYMSVQCRCYWPDELILSCVKYKYTGIEVLSAVTVESTIFGDVTPRSMTPVYWTTRRYFLEDNILQMHSL